MAGDLPDGAKVRRARTDELSATALEAVRQLLDAAFGAAFTEHDWDHTLGGTHLLVESDGLVVSHASVVPRILQVGDRRVATGYVEGVATRPDWRHRRHATCVMTEAAALIGEDYELGALSTGIPAFYARLGWEAWDGPTFVETAGGVRRTPDDDGAVMVLRTHATRSLDLGLPLVGDWREGDAW